MLVPAKELQNRKAVWGGTAANQLGSLPSGVELGMGGGRENQPVKIAVGGLLGEGIQQSFLLVVQGNGGPELVRELRGFPGDDGFGGGDQNVPLGEHIFLHVVLPAGVFLGGEAQPVEKTV